MANGRCKRANGGARRGIAHPNFVHGERSRYLPRRLKPAHDKALRDVPALLSLGRDLAVVEARIVDLIKRTDHGESGATWQAAQRAYQQLHDALDRGEAGQADAARQLNVLEGLLGRGAADAQAWAEIADLIDLRVKMATAERKGQALDRDSLRIEVMQAFYRNLVFAVHEALTAADITEEARQFIKDKVAGHFSRALVNAGLVRALPAGEDEP